jgi:hypothetical protein
VIFHTKYHKIFRAFLHSAQLFYVRPPITWNPGSAPGRGKFVGDFNMGRGMFVGDSDMGTL